MSLHYHDIVVKPRKYVFYSTQLFIFKEHLEYL